jgi:hypothetical protein
MGTPCPSVNRLRLTPRFARSVGFAPLFFPAQRGFGHRTVQTQPRPIDPLQFVKAFDAALPEFQKDACGFPFLETRVCRRTRTQVGFIQRFPLTAGAQDIEDSIRTFSIGHPRTPAAKAMRVFVKRQQRLEDGPKHVAHVKVRGGFVIWRTPPRPFRFEGFRNCALFLGSFGHAPLIS